MDRLQLFYTEAHVPLEYILGYFQRMDTVWSVFNHETIATYCAAKHIPLHTLNHKKQNDFWKQTNSRKPPSLLYMGFQASPSLQFRQFSRMVDWVWRFCLQQNVPLLLDRSHLSINEIPWLLPHSEKIMPQFPRLEIGSVPSNHAEQPERVVISGEAGWRSYLSHLPGFIRSALQQAGPPPLKEEAYLAGKAPVALHSF
jgi:hypothetical protein